MIDTRVIEWAAEECERQQTSPLRVPDLVKAWQWASTRLQGPGVGALHILAQTVEPELNKNGFRRINVMVGFDIPPDWTNVPRLITRLVDAIPDLDALEWYTEFERIHPYIDGNGRVGAILWNWFNGTLEPDRLTSPPDVFAEIG